MIVQPYGVTGPTILTNEIYILKLSAEFEFFMNTFLITTYFINCIL